MRFLLILIVILIACGNTYATKTTISGHFRYKPKKDIGLEYFASIFDRIELRKTKLETLVSDDRTFNITFDIAQPIMVTIKNGYNTILWNVFIFPGDSIHLHLNKKYTYASGKGSEKVEFMLKFATCYSKDSISYWQEYRQTISPFRKKTIDDAAPISYAKFWENRKNDHLNFLKEHLKGSTISQDFARLFEQEVTNEYAWQLLQYPGLYRKKYKEEASKENYHTYIKNIPINDTSAWVTSRYFNLLRTRIPYWFIPAYDIRDNNSPNTITYFKNGVKTWDSLAKQVFNEETYQVALYYFLYSSTRHKNYKLSSQAPTDSILQQTQQIARAHVQLLSSPILRNRIDSLLDIQLREQQARLSSD